MVHSLAKFPIKFGFESNFFYTSWAGKASVNVFVCFCCFGINEVVTLWSKKKKKKIPPSMTTAYHEEGLTHCKRGSV